MKKAQVRYLLNEKGRKASLLAGGDGERAQIIVAEATPEIINLAEISELGEIKLEIGFAQNERGNYEYVSFQKTLAKRYDEQPYISTTTGIKEFDAPQSLECLLAWERERLEANTISKTVQQEYSRLTIEYNAKAKARELAREKAETDRKAANEKTQAWRKATEEKSSAERLDWINTHGSDFLQKAVNAGYNCQRKYVTERAELELPDFDVDFDDNAKWRERACPSEEALDKALALIAKGHQSEVVWLTSGISESDCDFEPCEAIIIHDFLGKYDCVKLL